MDKVRDKSFLCIWTSALIGLILVLSSFFTACKVNSVDDVKVNHVKITYKTEFGEKPEAKEVDENTKITASLIKELLPALTADGYTFMGWVLEDSDTIITGNESEPFVIKSDIVLVAKWGVTVSYKTDVGTAPKDCTVEYGKKLTAAQLPELTADGYAFEGWYYGEEKVTADSFTATKNIEFTAKWGSLKYKITYVTDYGTAPEAKSVAYGTKITEKMLPELSADGCEFLGWFIDETQVTGKEEEPVVVKADIVLTAKWSVIKLSVTYKSEKGTAPEALEIEYGKKLTEEQLPDLTEEGFSFDGWYAGETKLEADSYEVTEDVELTAKWEVLTFKVTYKTAYGTAPSAVTVDYGTKLSDKQLPSLTNEEYNFLGWYAGETKAVAGTYTVKADTELTAKWEEITLTVSYKTAYGTAPASFKVKYGTALTADNIKDLSLDGYSFLGWYINSTETKASEGYAVKEDVQLTAKWEVITYKITYSTAQAKASAPKDFTVNWGTVLTAENLPELKEDGYTFLGWYIGTEKVSAADSYAVKSDVTVTAKWQVHTFKVTYKTDKGTAPSAITVDYGTKLSAAQLPTLTVDGLLFMGWYAGETKAEAGSYTVTADVELTGKWTTATYSVTYKSDFGTAPSAITVVHGTKLSAEQLSSLSFTKAKFLGWCLESTDTVLTAGSYEVKKNTTLVAKWEKNTYKVSYQSAYGTAPVAITVDYGTKLSAEQLTVLTDADYDFLGWYIGETKIAAGSYTVEDAVTLVAKWTEKQTIGKISLKVSTTETLELTYEKNNAGYTFTAPAGNYTYEWSIDGVEVGTGNTFILDNSNAPFSGEYTVHVTVFANGKAVNDAFTTVKIER